MGTKRILDDETRKAMLGYVPFSTDVKINFTPERFKQTKQVAVAPVVPEPADGVKEVEYAIPENLWPIFEVRSFTQAESLQLKSNYRNYNPDAKSEEIEKLVNDNEAIALKCVLGWSNFLDIGKCEEIDFSEANKKSIPSWIISEILNFVKKISAISAPEELSLK